jgi:hypothetical protein
MKIIGILRSLNDEAGAGTKILTASKYTKYNNCIQYD